MARDRDDDETTQIEYEPKLCASICALEGGGKTEFGFGMPGLIHYHSIDPNTAETLEKLQRKHPDKAIKLFDYEMPAVSFGDKTDIQNESTEVFEKLIDNLRPVIKRELRRMPASIVLDTGTEFFDLALQADHGKTVQILPEMRTKTNYKWKSLINALKRSGCNVVLLHRLRDKYENRTVRTREGAKEERVKIDGEYEREGFSKTGFIVNVEAFLFHDPDRDKGEQYGMRITRCTNRPILIGKEYWGTREVEGEEIRASSFASLATLVYKGTKLDDWR